MPNPITQAIKKMSGDNRTEEETALDSKLDAYWKRAESSRREIDWKWFNYDLWVAGHHYAKWDKNTQQILTSPRTDGKAKVTINKIYTTLRGVRSYVLQNRPKAEVTPFNLTPENLDQTVELNQYLDYLHDRLHLRTKLRATMWHALKYSLGFWQVLYDDSDGDGMGEVVVNVVDPYDLYWDPVARYPSEARYVVMAVRRTISDLQADPKYADFKEWDKLKADNKLAASTLKERMQRHERGGEGGDGDDKEGTVIVKEYWYKELADEEYEEESDEQDENGEKMMTKGTKKVQKIFLCTKAGDIMIRKPIDTGLDRWPFFRLPADVEPLSMYGNGWVKNMIPANRLLNRLESSAAEYNDIVNKGRYRVDKGAGLRTMYNEHGQLIEVKRGFALEPIPVPSINPALPDQIINANRYIEDLGAFHDAIAGRVPSGAKSGVAIEALQEGDNNNLSELVENTEEFLEDVYEYILYLASKKYQFARDIITTTNTGERAFIKLVGEEAADEVKNMEGATVIPGKNIVDVKITSNLAYTSEGRRQAVKDLAQVLGAQGQPLPPEIILDAYSVGPIADIMKKMREAQEEQKQQDQQQQAQQSQQETQNNIAQQQAQSQMQMQQKAQEMQMQQAQQQQQVQSQLAGKAEAIAFLRQILNGQKPDLPKNVGPEFIQYLDEFLQGSEAYSLPKFLLNELQSLRDQAVLQMKQNFGNMNTSSSAAVA